ncbi:MULTISPECIES: chemotaxis protein CheV [Alkalimonas]|uniref:Chemotaxis protein CheV n=1 Tax=Alkalimonas mucilaginosa TaxID=3057676 RepID=A0ABU7JJG8_9GAMM|nr:chemotaxis protein CheV [Alkalimonas sp. MEB004]MEE2025843.1 chemotaxis protein CheV [Alkalimonas sp. MEB004]
MASILDSVNQRTQLVGQNRLELLLFKLAGKQRYGINVFKVREVLQCPPLTALPKRNKWVRGIAHIRGQTISVIDLSLAIGGKAISDLENSFVVIAEYNRSVQGFLVNGVERIININWDSIMAPPDGTSGNQSYLTAVTEIDGELVEILDVEKVLEEISPSATTVSERISAAAVQHDLGERFILIADDSAVARNQVKKALENLGVKMHLVKNGREAFEFLQKTAAECEHSITEKVGLLISDIEMPEMDGYTLTAALKAEPKLQKLHVILHTSLSGVFNQQMVKKVGADDFIAKFNPDELAESVQKWLHVN